MFNHSTFKQNIYNICLLSFMFIILGYIIYNINILKNNTTKELSSNVIRLHILANSDSEEDQNIKLQVRDSIISYIQINVNGNNIKNKCDAKDFLLKNTPAMEKIADNILKQNNKTYNSKGYLTNCFFPFRKYNTMIFPEGEYEAYRLILGNGLGHNWWCVLYPPLCFLDNCVEYENKSEISTETKNEDITNKLFDDTEKPLFKFKFLSFLNDLF